VTGDFQEQVVCRYLEKLQVYFIFYLLSDCL